MSQKVRTLKRSVEPVALDREQIRSVVGAVHVVPRLNGGWEVTKSGSPRTHKRFDSKDKAINFAQRVSADRKGEIIVHERNGGSKRGSRNTTAREPSQRSPSTRGT